jgi:hypothetical protein
VCVTPVRNEAWVLERFLRAASMWADAIVVLDHASGDGSVEIAQRFPKVHVTACPLPSYDIHRGMLVEVARSLVPGPRILVALDADEFVASDAWHHQEMRDFLSAPRGTLARMRWINVLPDAPRAWIPPKYTDFMFIDDGSPFHSSAVHGARLPGGDARATVDLDGPKVVHLQYIDWDRMRAKQRWYQAQERIEYPRKRPIQIYRQYHHMDAIAPRERHRLRAEWLSSYQWDDGMDLLAVAPQDAYSTDARVLDLLRDHGVQRFRRIELWDGKWERRVQALEQAVPRELITDPHSRMERLVFRWLARTQHRSQRSSIRWVQRALRLAGW